MGLLNISKAIACTHSREGCINGGNFTIRLQDHGVAILLQNASAQLQLLSIAVPIKNARFVSERNYGLAVKLERQLRALFTFHDGFNGGKCPLFDLIE